MNKLSSTGIRYSPSEQRAFNALLKKQPASTVDLVKAIYSRKGNQPHNSRQVVLGVMTSLQRKVTMNDEPFVIERTERANPYPVEFWIGVRGSIKSCTQIESCVGFLIFE